MAAAAAASPGGPSPAPPPPPPPRADARNVLGGPLECCCTTPVTGWFRDGFCRTGAADAGVHTVCARVDAPFLAYTRARGNDLETPRPPHFPGLVPGDRWCLCAARWLEAANAGAAPRVVLKATDAKALEFVDLALLEAHAWAPEGADEGNR
jgi:hypothetical protein